MWHKALQSGESCRASVRQEALESLPEEVQGEASQAAQQKLGS